MTLLSRLFLPKAEPHVRAATAADAPQLARIHAASFHRGWGADEFERLLADRAAHAHMLCHGPKGAPFAFVLSHVVPPESEILSLAVAPEERGKGHGARLLSHHLGRLACEGVRVSHLEVEESNTAAVRLYRHLGYAEAGRRKGYYAGPEGAVDALVMRRNF